MNTVPQRSNSSAISISLPKSGALLGMQPMHPAMMMAGMMGGLYASPHGSQFGMQPMMMVPQHALPAPATSQPVHANQNHLLALPAVSSSAAPGQVAQSQPWQSGIEVVPAQVESRLRRLLPLLMDQQFHQRKKQQQLVLFKSPNKWSRL